MSQLSGLEPVECTFTKAEDDLLVSLLNVQGPVLKTNLLQECTKIACEFSKRHPVELVKRAL